MMHDDFEMENRGYEEECPSGNGASLERVSSSRRARSSTISRCDDRPALRDDPEETHVYEDIAVSPSRPHEPTETTLTATRIPVVRGADTDLFAIVDRADSFFRSRRNDREERSVSSRRDRFADECQQREDDRDDEEDETTTTTTTTNFHRNLTLPLRGTIDRETTSADRANRYSVRVTNRERRSREEENHVSADDPVRIDLEPREDEEDRERGADRLVDKPGRRRRKKDCKRCNKSKANVVSGSRDDRVDAPRSTSREASASTIVVVDTSGRIVHANNAIDDPDDEMRIAGIVKTNACESRLSPRHGTLRTSRLPVTRNNSIFAISNNVNSVSGSPKPLNYDKNETDPLRLTPVELNDDRALITPQKNRNGMKVNSIYSQDHWRPKDLPIFFTDVKEQTFQRAYSLPTRTHTPTSQNRVNLRRSVRGEPPPHPARLRKNRHGWTLHFARPLDATGCTRSIVLLLIAVLALLGIGAIALYIVFEPEKLQIIQQYLRSSTPNVTGAETNSTLVADSLDLLLAEGKTKTTMTTTMTTTLETPTSTIQLSENFRTLPRETTLAVEPEVQLATTTTKIETTPSDRNVTRYCDDCYEGEACVALVDEEVPVCRIGPDRTDPTGCNGLCLINKQKCHRLDFDAFRCVEVEHYCLDDEWTCANTLCIPLVKHCDGHMNCYDHSDEYDCDCDLQTHFQCGNETSCLPVERRCDGKIDCWDATDEMNCTLACPSSSEFTCSNGECILKARFCDGLRDCIDGSDEPHGCQGRCNKQEFSCLNGRCITKGTKCNGIDDCGDGSDEQHCRDRIYKKVTA